MNRLTTHRLAKVSVVDLPQWNLVFKDLREFDAYLYIYIYIYIIYIYIFFLTESLLGKGWEEIREEIQEDWGKIKGVELMQDR